MDQVPDKLHDHHRQQLSAMLDGALFPDAARFMLRRLQHDTELAACWERWQVCGDVMRGQRQALLPADFSQRVARGIAAERAEPVSAVAMVQAPHGRRWARWGGGAALAASVAVGALFVARQPPEQPGPPQVAAVVTTPAPSPPGSLPAPAAPDTATGLAAALAVAEVPRRVVQRRAQAQSRNAGAARARSAQQQVASAGAAGQPVGPADPFAGLAAVPAGRPWPRAILPAAPAASGFNVDFAAHPVPLTFDVGSPAAPLPTFRDTGPQPASSLPLRP